jgi:hypothetical protein
MNPNATGNTNVSKHQVSNQQGGISAATSAQLSACSYNPKCQGVGNWNRTTAGLGAGRFSDSSTGFQAALFRNSDTNAYALAFAGTQDGRDVKASILQYEGRDSPQFDEARKLAYDVKSQLGAQASLILTGHSLGGGLAAVASLSWHIRADIFNAEGLSKGTITRYGLRGAMGNANSLITAYHTALDPLTLAQKLDPGIVVPGRSVTTWNGLFHSGHSISSMCESLGTRC